MRALLIFLAVLIGALLVGVSAAYPFYLAASPFTALAFDEAALHSITISGVIFSLLYLRAAGEWGVAEIGLRIPARAWRIQFAAALAIGIGLIAGMEAILVLLGVHRPDPEQNLAAAAIFARASSALIAGLLIAAFEETLFRGVLYAGIQRRLGAGAAVLLSSVVYAAAHFIKYPPPHAGTAIGWLTAFDLLPGALRRFADASVYDSIAAVFLLGVLLGLLRRHFGHVAAGIGLHAGVAATLLTVKYLTDFAPGSRFAFLVSHYDNYQGWFACAWLATAVIVFVALTRGAQSPNRGSRPGP